MSLNHHNTTDTDTDTNNIATNVSRMSTSNSTSGVVEWEEQTALLLAFATHLGFPQFPIASETGGAHTDNLAVLLQRQTLTAVKGLTIEVPGLHILAHDRHYTASSSSSSSSSRQIDDRVFTSRSLQLSVNTIDAAPSLLQNSVSIAFRSAVECRLRGWIYMLRRFLIAKQAEEKAALKYGQAKHVEKNSTCKEAKVLRALHSIAFSIQIERVQTRFQVMRENESSNNEYGEEKKVDRSDSERVTPEVKLCRDGSDSEAVVTCLRIPLLFVAEVTLQIMGQKNRVLISAPSSIVGTFSGYKAASLQGMKVEINEPLLRASMLQQARLVVRQAATMKMNPKDKVLSQKGMIERPITPVICEAQGSVNSSKVAATALMPPPAPRTLLPLVSPTATEWNTTLDASPICSKLSCPSLLAVPKIVRKVTSDNNTRDHNNRNTGNEGNEPNCVSPTNHHEETNTTTYAQLTKKRKLDSIPNLELGGW